ncbi:MAG: Mu-like prophage major head subunit gpT family protein [Deltaproteobacteria bacterium]|nr:Mu-like prophage major head subunit gpT family protein [Deltaproteobacteria bacterium]
MILNAENLRAASRGFRALFLETLGAAKPLYEQLAMVVPSSEASETYAFLKDLPAVREWVGDRVIHGLEAGGFTIVNRKWESTIGVKRSEIERDKLGLVKPRIAMLADLAAKHPDKLVFELLAGGFASLCFDGQYFFDTDHPVDGASVSNKGTGVLNPVNYRAAYAAMMALRGDNGESLGITPTHLLVPPQLRATGLEILKAETIESTTNIDRDSAELVVAPQLSAHPTYWFLLDLSKPLRPFIVQILSGVEFTPKDRPDDDNAFMRDEFLYGTRSEHAAGYGLWQLAYGSTGGA